MRCSKLFIIKRKTIRAILFLLLFVIGLIVPFLTREPKVKIGERYIFCNPKAKINLKKRYVLRLWDYDWPLRRSDLSYRKFMEQAIADFQKMYPNITVDLTLIDLLTGPVQLEEALKSNTAPDVYCSAYVTPSFNFKRQIPIGPFLKRDEKELYFANFLNLLTKEGVLCYFPRWTVPGLWIGNRSLLEDAGFSTAAIQNNGWTWEELVSNSKKVPTGNDVIVGNLGFNGLFTQLVLNCERNVPTNRPTFTIQGMTETISFLETLHTQRSISSDLEYNMLGKFLSGKSLLLAGVRLSLYPFVCRKLADENSNFEPVLLPVPTRFAGKEVLTSENGVIAIYRNRRTTGDDHITAAVKLGQFLSCYENTTPWEEIMAYPAAKNNARNWMINTNIELYNKVFQRAFIRNIQPIAGYQENIYPTLKEFFNKKISREEFILKIKDSH